MISYAIGGQSIGIMDPIGGRDVFGSTDAY
jgi:hypothetical protein